MVLDSHFDRIVVISLPRAGERLARCLDQLRSRGLSDQAVVFPAVDGRHANPPQWWPNGAGAWGCYLSHLQVLQSARADGVRRLLILEDDCVWSEDAAERVSAFMDQVPADWDQLYLGGQHRITPLRIAERPGVFRGISVFRTHAYAVTLEAMPAIIAHLEDTRAFKACKVLQQGNPREKHHVDHHFEKAHRGRMWNTYVPGLWMAGQGANASAISGRTTTDDSWWNLASISEPTQAMTDTSTETPFFIFGTPRCRSTLLMRILDASPLVTCAGERRELLWTLKKLHGERDGLLNNSPGAFAPVAEQVERGQFPSHYNRSSQDSWNAGIAALLRGWINPKPGAAAWGMKDVHLAKAGSRYGLEVWSWLQNTVPGMKLIFIVRDVGEVLASMERTRNWWIPSYGACMTECSFNVGIQQDAFAIYHGLNSSSTVLLQSDAILDFEKLRDALAPLGIHVDEAAHAEQLAVRI